MEDLNCWTGSESTDEQQEHDEDAALGHLGRSEKEVCQIKWHYMALHWHFFKDKPADFEGCSIFRRNAKGNEESVASLIASGIWVCWSSIGLQIFHIGVDQHFCAGCTWSWDLSGRNKKMHMPSCCSWIVCNVIVYVSYIYIFMYTHIYIYIYIHVHTYIYIYIHVHIYIYIDR